MWDVPIYRIRAYVRNLKKSRQESGLVNPSSSRPPILHLKRSAAQILIPERMGANRELIHGSVILNDISPRGLFLFSSRNLRLGERVTLVIHHPRTFYAHGKVVLCKRLSLRENVVSTGNTFPFRAGILFEFRSIDERLSVKNYCDELAFKWLKIAQISN